VPEIRDTIFTQRLDVLVQRHGERVFSRLRLYRAFHLEENFAFSVLSNCDDAQLAFNERAVLDDQPLGSRQSGIRLMHA